MSRQKCKLCQFRNALVKKLKNVTHFKLHLKLKGSAMISNKENVENKALQVGFYFPENRNNRKFQAENKSY